MTAHHAIEMSALDPIGVPSMSPRSVSMIGVNGWFSANHATGPGIESVGTKPLLKNGSRMSGIGRLLAASTVLDTKPMPTESHVKANDTIVRNPNAASHS